MNEDQQTSVICKLSDLGLGESAEILDIDQGAFACALQERIHDYGIRRGEYITCAYKSIWGDPTAYVIQGNHTVLAIRRQEANLIRVRRICGSAASGGNGGDRLEP